jgi:aspartate/tyrosine/aromatic aminotransferase
MDNEYLPIHGLQSFSEKAVNLIYGEDFVGLKENRVAYIQCLSGTGGVRMAFEFATRFLGKENVTVHIPAPSWPSHKNICSLLEINHRLYNYYDK